MKTSCCYPLGFVITCITLTSNYVQAANQPCRAKYFGDTSIVCTCDTSYCDTYNPVLPSEGKFLLVTSNKDGLRFAEQYGEITCPLESVELDCQNIIHKRSAVLKINHDQTYQNIIGFGGAFTDAAGYNIGTLSANTQQLLMNAYFTSDGLSYNLGRTPIGHTDFSFNEYYYDNTPYDINMTDWKLVEADYQYKIPYIQWAKDMIKDDFYLVSSLWTVPQWMRKLDDVGARSSIIEKYYDSYVLYIIKYLQAYKQNDIEFWGLSVANEPFLNSGIEVTKNAQKAFTVWPTNKIENFATEHFVPALRKYGFNDTKLLFIDDSLSDIVYYWITALSKDKEIKKYLDVYALHAYAPYVSPSVIDDFHKAMPDVPIITTELCAGQKEGVKLGKWQRAEFYVDNYLTQLNHHVSGWIDWNLALDSESQPIFVGVVVDAPIIVFPEEDIFYKQPSYYAIGHFSKFMPRGSLRVKVDEVFATDLKYGAVLRPDGYTAVVISNPTNNSITTTIKDKKGDIRVTLTPNSVNTVVY